MSRTQIDPSLLGPTIPTNKGGTGLSSIGSTSQELRVNSGGSLYYGTNVINVMDYGATGNGSTDDTTAIQNALNAATIGQTVFFPIGTYKISAGLAVPQNITLLGCNTLSSNNLGTGTVIQQTVSAPIFTLYIGTSTVATIQNIAIKNFQLYGGNDPIYAQNGGVWVTLDNIYFGNFTDKAIYMRGFNQQWFVSNCTMQGNPSGNYGIYLSETGIQSDNITTGTPILFDTTNWTNLTIYGMLHNGIYLNFPSGAGDLATFYNTGVGFCTQDGIVLGGAVTTFVFNSLTTEQNGYNPSPTTPTTATTIAGNTHVTVASGTGYVNGQTLTIAGAGTNGIDWYPVISSGGGTTTLVMTTTAPTSVSNAECVNYIYSDVKCVAIGGSAPQNITFISPFIGNNYQRYAIDTTGANGFVIIEPRVGRPIYDPGSTCIVLGWVSDNNTRRSSLLSTSPASAINASQFNAAGYLIGTVVQQIQVIDTSSTISSGTSYTSTTTAASITPKSVTHKIRISVTGVLASSVNVNTSNTFASLFRGSTNLDATGAGFARIEGGAATTFSLPCSMAYLDSPATTSSTTYTVKIASSPGSGDAVWNVGSGSAVILIEEIAA